MHCRFIPGKYMLLNRCLFRSRSCGPWLVAYLAVCFATSIHMSAVADESTIRAALQNDSQSTGFVLEIDVLTQPQPAYRINAQKWGRVFQDLGYVAKFRDGRPGEKTRIENIVRSGTQTVQVVCIMEADGRIAIRDRRLQMSEPQAIVNFLELIRAYGAAGPPSESPTWGLTSEQFAAVTQLLSTPVSEPVILKTPMQTIDSLRLPDSFRLRFTEAAKEKALMEVNPAIPEQDLVGISKGTALAIALAQYGLGFRALQNTNVGGGYLIEVDAGNESTNMWPVGWKTREALGTVLPELYKAIPVEVEDVPLDAFVSVIADKLQIPDLYSSKTLIDAGRNPAELRYSRKPDRVSPSRLLTLLGDHFQLGLDVRADEKGKCFVWVTTRDETLAFRRRFAHIVPGKP